MPAYFPKNVVVLCVDKKRGFNFAGRMYHFYEKDAIPFSSFVEAQIRMERFYDELGFPQPSMKAASFPGMKGSERKDMTILQSSDSLAAQKGDIATFIIHVQHRQNATWQGNIVWADNKSKCTFHSALEMLKLMSMALESVDDNEEEGGA